MKALQELSDKLAGIDQQPKPTLYEGGVSLDDFRSGEYQGFKPTLDTDDVVCNYADLELKGPRKQSFGHITAATLAHRKKEYQDFLLTPAAQDHLDEIFKPCNCPTPCDDGCVGSNTIKAHQERKDTPVYSGVLMYFPNAIRAIAQCSKIGNDQHNPGTDLHWDRAKSGDEKDALLRHLMEAGGFDTDGVRHSTKVAWRALAALEKELEHAGWLGAGNGHGEGPDYEA